MLSGRAILLARVGRPEVIEALRSVVPGCEGDPGRDYWIAYAKALAKDLKRIEADPDLNARRTYRDAPPKSAYVPVEKK